MILPIQHAVRTSVADALTRLYGLDAAGLPALAIEMPPNRALGDLAVPVAFELARRLRKAPRAIAQELAAALGPVDGVARVEAAPNGYLNVFLDRAAFLRARSAAPAASPAAARAARARRPSSSTRRSTRTRRRTSATCATRRSATRSCACCASAARRSKCRTTSTTPASRSPTSSSASASSSSKTLADVQAHRRRDAVRLLLLGPLRARHASGTTATRRASRSAPRRCTTIEHGGNETAAMGAFIADRIVRCHLKTMARLNIGYDLLTWEGDILRLQFWAHGVRDRSRPQGAVFLQTEGKLAGCWVMRIDDDAAPRATERRRRRRRGRGAREGHRPLERHRHLRRQGHRLPVLEVRPARPGLPLPPVRGRRPTARRCGPRRRRDGRARGVAAVRRRARDLQRHRLAADRTCRRCSKQALRDARPSASEAEHSIHFSYEMVALSHATARELGYAAEPERRDRSRSSRCRAARASA